MVAAEDHYVTWKAATTFMASVIGSAIAILASIIGAVWFLSNSISVGNSGLNDKISVVREDVAVIKVQVASLVKTAAVETNSAEQAQYVLVQIPSSDGQAREKLIRDMLMEQGLLKGEE